jgi:hypothetical protein
MIIETLEDAAAAAKALAKFLLGQPNERREDLLNKRDILNIVEDLTGKREL